MERLSYRPISLADFEPYAEFLADPECTPYVLVPGAHSRELSRSLLERNDLIHPENAASIAVAKKLGAKHERDTEIRGGPVSIDVSNRTK